MAIVKLLKKQVGQAAKALDDEAGTIVGSFSGSVLAQCNEQTITAGPDETIYVIVEGKSETDTEPNRVAQLEHELRIANAEATQYKLECEHLRGQLDNPNLVWRVHERPPRRTGWEI